MGTLASRRVLALVMVLTARGLHAADGEWTWDPAIARAQLENGLRIVVIPCPGEVSVRLMSILSAEDEPELETRHHAEHVAMNSAAGGHANGFARIRQLGLTSGADVTAYTGWDRVDFAFDIPSDSAARLPAILAFTRDIAAGPSDPQRWIRAELGAIHAEHEISSAVREEALLDAFAGRPAIATEPGAEAHSVAEVARVVARMLDPSRLSVIVAGDVDPAAVLAQVRDLMRTIPATSALVSPRMEPAPARTQVIALVDTNERASWADVAWSWPMPGSGEPDVLRREDLAGDMLAAVAAEIVATRLQAEPDVAAGATTVTCRVERLPTRCALHLSASSVIRGRSRALAERLLTELERLRRLPSSDDEARVAFTNWVAAESWPRSAGASPAEATEEALKALVLRRPVVSVVDRDMAQRYMAPVAGELLVDRAFPLGENAHLLVALGADAGEPDAVIRVESFLAGLATRDLGATPARVAVAAAPPERGGIVERMARPDGETWVLSNGMRVIVRRSAAIDDIILAATAPGGFQPDRPATLELAWAAWAATPGVVGLGPGDLKAASRYREPAVAARLDPGDRGLTGVAPARDPEGLLQTVHRCFTAGPPGGDELSLILAATAERLGRDNRRMVSALLEALLQSTHAMPSARDAERATIDDVRRGWSRFFSHPESWVIAIDVPEATTGLEEAVETWLASIPARDDPAAVAPVVLPSRPEVDGTSPLAIAVPEGERARLFVVAPARAGLRRDADCAVYGLARDRIHGILRVKRRTSYTVHVLDTPAGAFSAGLLVSADVAPDDARVSAAIVMRELRRLAKKPVTAPELDAALAGPYCRYFDDEIHWAGRSARELLGTRAPQPPADTALDGRALRDAFRDAYVTAPALKWLTLETPR